MTDVDFTENKEKLLADGKDLSPASRDPLSNTNQTFAFF
jgi:hypothetical protein